MSLVTVFYLIIVAYAAASGFIGYCAYLRYKSYRQTQRAIETRGIREAALCEWEALGKKMRAGKASFEDAERSFFLDDVIVRPSSYEMRDGDFKRVCK
jgi:hypothetical protein